MIKIGYRTSKTALGIAVSILIAEWIGLHNSASAGIIAILCIQNTKQQSLKASWTRLVAGMLALFYSAVFFELLAYHAVVIGLILIVFIPTTVALKVQEGIVSSTVLILHMYAAKEVSTALLLNEMALVIIGVGIALVLNSYMPSVENELVKMQQQTEELFERIFKEIISYLRTNEHTWDGKELTETAELLKRAKSLSYKDVQNHFTRHNSLFYQYFTMREKQFEIIERLISVVISISHRPEQAEMIASFMEEVKGNIHPGNTAKLHLSHLNDLKREFEEMPLPKTREEFEARAALLQFVREMERYLRIKARFRGMKKRAAHRRRPSVT
ncbi:aromatic acid exporter family protein [Domibacillus sp. 8LH]|uniref:aromatic acid exporter family protein n=1 Tax=Domibacillus TaxID=1433999 RepID=UPI00203A900B|nr:MULTISPECIES: aromatic acid exporter family protein [Domibacillus]MCM3788357.1 aromatic acid exporter family protein [Domibacillus indicus]WNS82020.1 aromatic acid exporter family protein [Domibacillus sp. DTU_2020_1001157_1_SI_ALB_TIR_016]